MKTDDLEYSRKELNRASNLGIFALVGAIIPIIGLILGVVAFLTASSVNSDNQTRAKRSVAMVTAVLAILLSIGAGFGYYVYYKNVIHLHKQAACERGDYGLYAKEFPKYCEQAR